MSLLIMLQSGNCLIGHSLNQVMSNSRSHSKFLWFSGLEIRGCPEPMAPLSSPAAPSNFCREPKDVLVSIHNTFLWLLKMQLGSLEKKLNF